MEKHDQLRREQRERSARILESFEKAIEEARALPGLLRAEDEQVALLRHAATQRRHQ